MRAALLLALVALVPGTALASGLNLPWWGEAIMFLLFSPWGWACAALWFAVLVASIVVAARRWIGRSAR